MSVISPPDTSSTTSANGLPSAKYWPNAGQPLTDVATSGASRHGVFGAAVSTAAIVVRPRNHHWNGGIDVVASSCSSAASAGMS